MKKLSRYFSVVFILLALAQPGFSLEEISDEGLSDVNGAGVAVEIEIGQVDLGYFQFIDDDGADLAGVYGNNLDYGDGATNGNCGSDGSPASDALAAASNCGAVWITGEMYGDYYIEMDTGQTILDVSDAQTGVDCSGGPGPTCTTIPALRVVLEITDYSIAAEGVSGYDVTVAPGGQGSWGDEMRLTNFENARLEMNMLFYSPRNTDEDYRISGTGIYFEDLTIPDEFVFDLEYKDSDLTGSDSDDPGNASYFNNRIQIIDISPTKGDVVFEGMTMEFDSTDGIVIDFPTLKGSFQFGDEGDTSGGIVLAGVQNSRVLFDEWNFDIGVLQVKAH